MCLNGCDSSPLCRRVVCVSVIFFAEHQFVRSALLLAYCWHIVVCRRVVFDEGHALKNVASGTTRAAMALTAPNRWVVTVSTCAPTRYLATALVGSTHFYASSLDVLAPVAFAS
jgi:hypothetical protein